jgi:pyruvate dehydrogenase E2 component (dihydrolipoamide acetyltransferase)
MSDTMTEGVISTWVKKVGDKVKSGDVLAEVETDKATMELESYSDGTLLYIGVEEGNSVAVEGILAVIGEEGEDYKNLLTKENSTETTKSNSTQEPVEDLSKNQLKEEITTNDFIDSTIDNSDNRLKASPLAKKIAEQHHHDEQKQ